MWSDLRIRVRSLLRRGRTEAELADEIRFHLEQAVARNLARGMTVAEARRQARLEFGGIEQIKEECRDARGVSLVEDAVRDARYAARRLLRDWRFSAAAILVLTLGIGANTAIFSIVNAALFREQPFADPDSLVNIYQNVGDAGLPEANSFPVYQDIAQYNDLFSSVGASFAPGPVRYNAGNGVRPAVAEFATSTYLEVLGLEPTMGRWFDARDDEPGAAATAVVSHLAWRTRFDSDPGILDRTLRVNGEPVTIVGVGPEGLIATLPIGIVTDLWLSIASLPPITGRPDILGRRADAFLVKARLESGVTLSQARAAMDALGKRLALDFPDEDPGKGITVLRESDVRIHPQIDAALAPGATVLLVSVGLVLAIACSNLATLLLVRGASRSKEVSLRLSLGATRVQVIRHLLTESVLLSIPGGIAGCLLAAAALRILSRVDLPLAMDLSLDYRVLAFTVVLTLLTGTAVGLAPALRASKIDLLSALRDEGEALSLGRRWFSLKNALVVSQVVVSFLLLVGMSFSLRMLVTSRAQDVGFAVDGVAMLETDARYAGYSPERARAVYEELRERVAALPGVESTALTVGMPMNVVSSVIIDVGTNSRREPSPDDASEPRLSWVWAGTGHFETLDIPILYGRTFDDRDRPDTPPVAVVSEGAARRYFGTVNAVGRRFRFEDEPESWTEIVGVVPDTFTTDLSDGMRSLLYRPLAQSSRVPSTLLVRSSRDANSLLGAMQRELRDIDPALPVMTAKTMAQHLDDSLLALELAVAFLGGLGAVGLALACVGLYAVVAFAVAQRSREIGIRTALGGRTGQVTWAIAADVAKLMAIAVAIGAGISLVGIQTLGRIDMSSPASGVHLNLPTVDAGTLPVVALVMLGVGLAAGYLPARRAARVDPLVVLRHE